MQPHFSVIIPFLNEDKSIRELYDRLVGVLGPMGPFELIFIDDGSTDGSYAVVKELHTSDPRVRAIKFRKNQGKSAALSEGFAAARGEAFIMIDADLQDEPAEIPKMVGMLDGADLVTGWKQQRNDPWTKTFPSRVFNGFARMMFGLKLHDLNCGLKVMRADVARSIGLYGDMHRLIPVLAHLKGFTVAEMPVVHHERKYGVSKYGWKRFFRGTFDLMTVAFLGKFQNSPLYLFGSIGGVTFAVGALCAVYLVIVKLQGNSIGERPLLIFSVLMILTGLQFIFTGLLAELIVSRFREHRIPVQETLDNDDGHTSR